MEIKKARFIMGNTDISKCPPPNLPEFAFTGRSNVGKSSLINMLVDNKKLAKTSSQPGKTQQINHFLINDDWYLVDLPGYGYAKVSKAQRRKFSLFIRAYILKRENLYCLFVLIDSRLAPQEIDLEFITWLGQNSVPFVLVFTKADKPGKIKLQENIDHYRKALEEQWEELPPMFVSSAIDETGKNEILSFIANNK